MRFDANNLHHKEQCHSSSGKECINFHPLKKRSFRPACHISAWKAVPQKIVYTCLLFASKSFIWASCLAVDVRMDSLTLLLLKHPYNVSTEVMQSENVPGLKWMAPVRDKLLKDAQLLRQVPKDGTRYPEG